MMGKTVYKYLIMGLVTLMSQPLAAQDVAKEYDLQEVQVTGKRHGFGVRSSQMSAIAVSAEQIRRLPKLLGEADILKSLQQLPGVQSGGEGRSGIYVRGGDYDQNLFLLDGVTLYNPEHLQGFTSAANTDLIDDVILYKGAFPSRFGSRLSSVVDINLRDGDMERFHASVTAGMLASGIQAEGPLWKGHTSFNIGARVSYFNAIVRPLLEEVVYDNPGQMDNYSHMRYFDINGRLTHRFNDSSVLSGSFYVGHDTNNATPEETEQHFAYGVFDSEMKVDKSSYTDRTNSSRTTNGWDNILGGLTYTWNPSSTYRLEVGAAYSGYRYRLSQLTEQDATVNLDLWGYGAEGAMLYSYKSSQNEIFYKSGIDDFSGRAGITIIPSVSHELRFGVQGGVQLFTPSVTTSYRSYQKQALSEDVIWRTQLGDGRYTISEATNESGLCTDMRLSHLSAYGEDDWDMTGWLKLNVGLHLQGYISDGQTRLYVEPRASARILLAQGVALKASYARMTQGAFLMTSGSMVTPSEVWIPFNGGMKPGVSDQLSAGVSHDMGSGISLSLEAYYKWLDNVTEYKEGSSFVSAGDWDTSVAQGRGRAYGLEFLAQKTTGNTRGHISYTWSKSLRTFDRPGMEINGGREFYASGDRRHNLSVSLTQRLSRNWDLSASWTYQSGRRTNIAAVTMNGGMPDEFNAYMPEWIGNGGQGSYQGFDYTNNPDFIQYAESYYLGTHIEDLVRMDTYRQRNGYTLPPVHRLDISLSHHGSIGIGEMICDIGIYNVYNRQNISSVYWGYRNNRPALMGVCLLPFMPSLSLTLKL